MGNKALANKIIYNVAFNSEGEQVAVYGAISSEQLKKIEAMKNETYVEPPAIPNPPSTEMEIKTTLEDINIMLDRNARLIQNILIDNPSITKDRPQYDNYYSQINGALPNLPKKLGTSESKNVKWYGKLFNYLLKIKRMIFK
jgi:hypothetical protein